MITYAYKLVTRENKVFEGETRTLFKKTAVITLEKDGSTVLFIARKKAAFFNVDIPFLTKKFPAIEKISFFRNFATMLESGISMVIVLSALSEQVKNKKTKQIISEIAHEVKNGKKLSVAMSKYPDYFSGAITETIRVGEISGTLNSILDRIADDIERNYELRKKVVGAIAYPAVIVFVMFVVLIGLIVMVLPKIEDLFDSIGAEPPFLTAMLLSLSSLMRTYPFIIIFVFVTIIVAIILILRQKKGRYAFHLAAMKLPIFGELIKEFNLTLFFRSLNSLLVSGISLVEAVEVSKNTLQNDVYIKAIDSVHPLLLYGSPLTGALKPYPNLFPTQPQLMVEVGEKTGRLQKSFDRVANHYERSVNYRTSMMTTLLEPIIMVIVGVAVGILALSIFLPIYQVADLI